MRFSFRLAQLLNYSPDPKKRPGVIKAICEYTKLDRHQVAALLRNKVKNVPLDALSSLCDYLVEHGYATADELPGALFAVEAENFWELLARRRRLDLAVGVRRTDQPDWPEGAWVVASDAVLLGELLNGVSTLGGAAALQSTAQGNAGNKADATPQPKELKQALVWSPGQGSREEVLSRAAEVYADFSSSANDKALLCIGSPKSNPLGEHVMSNVFSCAPFESQDEVAKPTDRACPFFLRFRQHDPHPDSCFGGIQLSRWEATDAPGIYYEQADGTWAACKCDEPQLDAAFVFYAHRESQGWLEMVLGGFSGRATRLLAKTLATRAHDFWPPVYEGFGIEVGAFIVQYTVKSQADRNRDLLQTDLDADVQIIRLAPEVIRRRLQPAADREDAEELVTSKAR